MKFLAPLRLAVRSRAVTRVPALARSYAVDPWTGPEATESEADVRADQDTAIHGKPNSILQQETVEELHNRTEEAEYHAALENELKVKGKPNMTDSEAAVRADQGKTRLG